MAMTTDEINAAKSESMDTALAGIASATAGRDVRQHIYSVGYHAETDTAAAVTAAAKSATAAANSAKSVSDSAAQIAANTADIAELQESVEANTGDIADNTADITTHAKAITALQGTVENNTAQILENAISVNELDAGKVNLPGKGYLRHGLDGQYLRTHGDGTTEWVTQGTPTEEQVKTAVYDWMDDNPDERAVVDDGSLTAVKFADGAVTRDKIYNPDLIMSRNAAASRMFRIVRTVDDDGVGSIGFQGAVYFEDAIDVGSEKTGFLAVCGSTKYDSVSKEYTNQTISLYTFDGALHSSYDYTDLRHANSIAYNPNDKELIVVHDDDSASLSYIKYKDLSSYSTYDVDINVIAADYYKGQLYVMHTEKINSVNYLVIYTVDSPKTSSAVTPVVAAVKPDSNKTVQDFTIHDGIAYIVIDDDNQIMAVDLSKYNILEHGTAAVTSVDTSINPIIDFYQLGEGNELFPYGEVESPFFVDEQLCFISALYLNSGESLNGNIGQIFKTNIGAPLSTESKHGQSMYAQQTVYVDSSSENVNPRGTSANPFKTLLEASAFVNYHAKDFELIGQQLNAVSGSSFPNEVLHASSSLYVRMHNADCLRIELFNGVFGLREVNAETLYVRDGVVNISNSTIAAVDHVFGQMSFGPNNTSDDNYAKCSFERCIVVPYSLADTKEMSLSSCKVLFDMMTSTVGTPTLELTWNSGGTAPTVASSTFKTQIKGNQMYFSIMAKVSDWGESSSTDFLVVKGFDDVMPDGIVFDTLGDSYANYSDISFAGGNVSNLMMRMIPTKSSGGVNRGYFCTLSGGYVSKDTFPTGNLFIHGCVPLKVMKVK